LLDRVPLLTIRAVRRLRRERAQTLAEYGLILTLVAVGVTIPTLIIFREMMITAFNAASSCLDGSC
jgi:Flp pilus assembly pilin Flp